MVERPALRYHGGKWKLAAWIIQHFPPHRIYVEPFGGGASVLLRKPRSYAEIYNDLDGEIVGLFRVLRDPEQAAGLVERLRLTPFARVEFEDAYQPTDDPVERARRLLIRSFMGFGSDGFNTAVKTGFRAASNRSGTTPAHDWGNYPDALATVVDRLRGVVVENRDAMTVALRHDGLGTLHYFDPPYLAETRSNKGRRGGVRYHAYRHEMTDADHVTFLAAARELAGMVVISGYPARVYDESLAGWHRVEKRALADGARTRTEVLWINPAAAEAQRDLFAEAGR